MLRSARRVLLVFSCLSLFAFRAEAVVIDSFDGGALAVPTTSEVGVGTGTIVKVLNSPAETYDILSTYSGGFSSTLTYLFDPATDLLGNVIQIEFGSTSGAPPGMFSVTVEVDGVVSTPATQSFSSLGQSFPLTFDFDFAGTSEAGLGSVGELIVTVATSQPGAFSMTEIRAVPEPATAMMLGLGITGLTMMGRRRTA